VRGVGKSLSMENGSGLGVRRGHRGRRIWRVWSGILRGREWIGVIRRREGIKK
jgi:hypothetical protein